MDQRQISLHHRLEDLLGSSNIYFEPPESFKLQYPCIVYSFEGYIDYQANNQTYRRMKRYALTYITRIADDPMVEKIQNMRYCNLNRPFSSADLHHYSYTLFD